jgi:hypothetical protein
VTPVIAQADRASWQRQAAAELARILEGHPELPCIAWTVGPASPVLTGQVSGPGPAPQVQLAFAARRQALGLGECREQPGGGGVTVRLTATVFEQEEA